MVETAFTCRHCGRPIAVPASNCPWCGQQIMVICASCKAYTDDQKPFCERCGKPLQPDRMERLALLAHHPEVARLVQDQERAQLVASAVLVNNLGDFFYDDGRGYRTVLVELLGPIHDRQATAAGVLLAAYAYLCQKGYCSLSLRGAVGEEEVTVAELQPWDGQQCIEGALAQQIGRVDTARAATDRTLRALMGFRVMTGLPDSLRVRPRDASERSAFAALDQGARLTVLPDHDRREACRTTYQMLVEFVEADRKRARLLATELIEVLGWFERYERDPSLGMG